MQVKSAVLREIGASVPYEESQPIKIETLELDSPEKDEVLIQIKAASLCHSDLSVMNGSRPRPVPMALGHEAAGVVVDIGQEVTDLEPGDHVVCVFVPSCGQCGPCREGRPALCERGAAANTAGTLLGGGQRLHKESETINHHLGVSAFSEYAVVSRNSIIKISKDIPFEKAALFGCAVITGVGAVVNTASIKLGSTVAVVGLGGVGLSALLGAIAAGASRIVAVDINETKLKQAKELGAADVFNSKDPNVIEQIRQATGGGLDYAFETAGAVPAMEVAYGITKRGGTTVTTGLPHPEHQFSFPYVSLTAEERTLKGSYLGSCVPSRDIPRYMNLFQEDRLPVDKLITDFITLDEVNKGFDILAKGESSRIIIKF
ncbi:MULTISPECIES: zinc-dependent alcohol dehydrogenase family protein [Planococcus]|uniref:Zinc-dependent alcohol dehydrogenase family protein n=1 Tax=Planococcus wigleyi TaxID=2762216 RepID=A0ABR8WG02_9BACL|nr:MULTISPECIES: zinc-dependent alcohol dehydrogenase family protein [Planococcus]MBD8015991.1 zinc-dependent alcohol dehydrogenase family protein [Planococcus wigleyi]MBF6632766.1 zinc-dependent alcohol dehydrogenase family protein [Planococcus sp. (in: firmicutes)]MDN3438556.1 zinc-dependent alcohol dehydrogenase family protein [Planococcus sp. APC 3900]